MKKLIIILAALFFCLGGAAYAENDSVLGSPFPDFTAVSTQGETFTLSDALKSHDAVLINIWATWCPPCEAEFPYLTEAYRAYGDQVAFIALSCESRDTQEAIESYRVSHGIPFPMGRDEGQHLASFLNVTGIPTTVIVDRFGNAVFRHTGAFAGAGEISRVIETFLSDSYSETRVLDRIPVESSTRAFPLSGSREIIVENESAKQVVFSLDGVPARMPVWSVNSPSARLLLKASAGDFPADMSFFNVSRGELLDLQDLLDKNRNAFLVDQLMPGPEEESHYVFACLGDFSAGEDPGLVEICLITGDEYIEEFAAELRSSGFDVSWQFSDSEPAAEAAPGMYILHIADQYGSPVPGAAVQFCTDTSCVFQEAGETGVIMFAGPQDTYHVKLLEVPEGFSFDGDFELTVGPGYGEWLLRIRKD